MKKLLSGIALLGVFVLASAQTIAFDKTTVDYGTVKTGSDGQRVFTIKNTGDKPLIISSVKASCGCTTPVWSDAPVLPGKSAEIKVGYNTSINGAFTKQIEVFSNDPVNARTALMITGTVDPNAVEKVLTPEELKLEAKAKAKAQKAQMKADKKNSRMAKSTAK
ncbi:DUF1573 domain-containing protein [Frigoriflavimonas asaccharolytica]|uniref:DUF1573 domain-containing protein n=1 Tax=Frigoriflavimonas asaccharolytica TaxID=2735899 RepID=A0A8J8K8X3_9FLAO|nr:DUF1573 domain-containing protein [Frigoriflavimonas asaccharolytica]NRS93333.1 hypothetical protein [Frigoriflavimonas asaccharolytica]